MPDLPQWVGGSDGSARLLSGSVSSDSSYVARGSGRASCAHAVLDRLCPCNSNASGPSPFPRRSWYCPVPWCCCRRPAHVLLDARAGWRARQGLVGVRAGRAAEEVCIEEEVGQGFVGRAAAQEYIHEPVVVLLLGACWRGVRRRRFGLLHLAWRLCHRRIGRLRICVLLLHC